VSSYRVGQGFDVHPLASGRRLIIGGVLIPHGKGLIGYSDADVLIHAVCDALLGAAGLPDIGYYFPPSDPRYKDADSSILLSQVYEEILKAGFTTIENIDCVVMAEKPKLHLHIPAMKRRMAEVLRITEGRIAIKATTCEKLGFVGREEGIAASAVCLISRHD
jgi:2-C-methyl-D-erythritol 2,4-cyclodiphosphate synthase